MDPNFVSVNLVWQVIGVITVVLVRLGWTWWRLKHIPGPFPACITDLHRMSWVPTARAHLILQDAHRKYGEVVRIGPNMVSFSNPEAIPAVYPMRPGIPKVLNQFSLVRASANTKIGRLLYDSAAIHEEWRVVACSLQHH